MREPEGRKAAASYVQRNRDHRPRMAELDKNTQPRLHVVLCNEGVAGTNTRAAGATQLAKYLRNHTTARDIRIVEYAPVRIRDT